MLEDDNRESTEPDSPNRWFTRSLYRAYAPIGAIPRSADEPAVRSAGWESWIQPVQWREGLRPGRCRPQP